LDSLRYEEHSDYGIVQSTNPAFHKAIVRVDIYRQHRQTVQVLHEFFRLFASLLIVLFLQYILPKDSYILSQAELVIIDEAAAIPLPYVKVLSMLVVASSVLTFFSLQELLGPYLVFMASTVNGYEGTGRALSLKLIEQLKQQCHVHSAGQMLSATDGLHENFLVSFSSYRPL
jgi:N-acetyltransferase 10